MNELTPEQIKEIAEKVMNTDLVFDTDDLKTFTLKCVRKAIEAGAKAQTELLAGVTDEEVRLTVEERVTCFTNQFARHFLLMVTTRKNWRV